MSRAISHYIWFGLNEGYMPALSLDVESSSMSYYLSLVERRVGMGMGMGTTVVYDITSL